ncbi:hypothetical protein FB451DRAFT_1478077 [Mycena latifolia]|nr:hypothetical protein FB451DRAFT_1478077 [Mycena latifolia]
MKEPANPVCIPELLDQYIGFLSDSASLKKCALVAKAWRHPAQCYIFRQIVIDRWHPSARWTRLERALRTPNPVDSARLIGYIRWLHIDMGFIKLPELCALCSVEFKNVHYVLLDSTHQGLDYSPAAVAAVLKLFSLPSLKIFSCEGPGCRYLNQAKFTKVPIKALNLSLSSIHSGGVNLAPYAHLAFLRIWIDGPLALERAKEIISTMAQPSGLRKIVIAHPPVFPPHTPLLELRPTPKDIHRLVIDTMQQAGSLSRRLDELSHDVVGLVNGVRIRFKDRHTRRVQLSFCLPARRRAHLSRAQRHACSGSALVVGRTWT